jgi:hypothetical protein
MLWLALVDLNEAGFGGQFGISDLPGRPELRPIWAEIAHRSLSEGRIPR